MLNTTGAIESAEAQTPLEKRGLLRVGGALSGSRLGPIGLWCLLGCAAVLFPLVYRDAYWLEALTITLIYIPAALGQNLIVGNGGQLAMGHAAFFGVGAYAVALLTTRAGINGLPSLLIAGLASGLVGLLVGFPALRISGDYLFIVALGFNLIFLDILTQWQSVTGGAIGIPGVPTLVIFGLNVDTPTSFYMFLLVVVAICCLATGAFTSSRFGKVVEALRDDQTAAMACGIRQAYPRVLLFGMGCGLAGIGGACLAYSLSYVGSTSFGVDTSILIFEMAVIGGLGRVSGSVLGALIMVLLPEVFQSLQSIRDLLGGIVVIGLMAVRPQGLLGKYSIKNLISK